MEVGQVTLLHPDGKPLSSADNQRPLLLIDSSWRDLPRVLRGVTGDLQFRSLPKGLKTAYPRKSSTFADPEAGLASIEALYAACALLGFREESLLNEYYWREEFLKKNQILFP